MALECMHCIHMGLIMAMLTIRNIDDDLKARLRLKAAQAGCSMEETVRLILRQATTASATPSQPARQLLLDHLAQVEPAGTQPWSRDELYD